jgi:hypothetical protein
VSGGVGNCVSGVVACAWVSVWIAAGMVGVGAPADAGRVPRGWRAGGGHGHRVAHLIKAEATRAQIE